MLFRSIDKCFADGLVYESLKEARDADIDTVQVAKLRSDVYSKTAGKVSREEWGDKVQMEVKQTHSVDIKNLLELREARLMALDVPVVVQAQPMPVVQQVCVRLGSRAKSGWVARPPSHWQSRSGGGEPVCPPVGRRGRSRRAPIGNGSFH